MSEYVLQGSIWLNRSNFRRYIFSQVDVDKFALISLNNGQRWSEVVHAVGACVYLGDGKFKVRRSVFEKCCDGAYFEETTIGGTQKDIKTDAPAKQAETWMDIMFKAGMFDNLIPVTKEKEKPSKIQVVRYVRPKDEYGNILGNKGVTLVYDIDFDIMWYQCRYSICNGDTFDKKKGVELALESATGWGTIMSGNYDKSISLMANLIRDLERLKEEGTLSKRNTTLLSNLQYNA